MSAVLLLVTTMIAAADEPTHDIVPEDAFTLHHARDVAVNRTGSKVAYVRAHWDDETDHLFDTLWLLDTRRRTSDRLALGDAEAWSPSWSPDDAFVYFLSTDDDGRTQVFRTAPTPEATPQQVTRIDHGVGSYQLAEDGEALWYVHTRDEHADDAWDPFRDQHGDVRYQDATVDRSAVHRLDLDTFRSELVWETGGYVMDWEVSPDESKVAILRAPDSELIYHEGPSEALVLEVEADRIHTLDDTLWRDEAPSPYGWLLGLAWSSDGRALAHRVDFDGYPGETFVTEFAGGEPETWRLGREHEYTPVGSDLQWIPGRRDLCQRMADRGRVRLLCTTNLRGGASGRERVLPEAGNVVLRTFDFSGDGRDIVAIAGTPESFPELFRLPARGALPPVQLTDLNPHTDDWKLPTVEVFTWTAPDGTQVEGILELPHGYDRETDGPLPTVLQIHGGPTSHTPYQRRFRAYGQTAFAAKGWALLSPNYRGSIGYGDTFLVDLVGRENDVEVADLMSGVDALVEAGIADPEHMAVMGWSNGGYLTNCLISRTDRFKAASSGAGVFDQVMQWALEDTPGHVINYMQGLPWEQPEHVRAASPLYQAHQITTPTLIHFGEYDERVPLAHGLALHRALDFYLDVPTELVIYPDTGHSPRSMSLRKTKMAWDHAWFERYVLGDDGGEGPAEARTSEPAPAEPSEEAEPAPAPSGAP